jgi:hypothetical protein
MEAKHRSNDRRWHENYQIKGRRNDRPRSKAKQAQGRTEN